ncbi:hypothetical protein RHMOL_Rhmol06G0140900 [Rhododendron molle]|uniref:Uncharacterized protein n=1 Tax=Rhododendron molle TaxID=49168 RepID=A0ACC0NCE5_RHOML|nr:hypothetical protein RHMOL_Rhmol06G0140900 [Rhododendron molle]
MIRAAQSDQNVILRVPARNQQKKLPGRASSGQFFLNGSEKNCSDEALPGHFFC